MISILSCLSAGLRIKKVALAHPRIDIISLKSVLLSAGGLRLSVHHMSCHAGFFRVLGLFILLSGMGNAGEMAWEERLARAFSGRLNEVKNEVADLTSQLQRLPDIPIDDQGGTGGFASIHATAAPEKGEPHAVEVVWPAPVMVDLVALVPARRYDAKGLEAHYGMPDQFTVELIDAQGKVVATVAKEHDARSHPVRRGHPFVYQISPAVSAVGLRITAERLQADPDGEGNYVHAWAEVFAFERERELAHGAAVHTLSGSAPPAPWLWKPEFLVDGQTPLGLPEIPAEEHQNVGWLSNGRESARESATLSADLGESEEVTAVRFLPARRPTSDLPSGFGFPRKLVISMSETGEPDAAGNWQIVAERDFRNPGHNPVLVSFATHRGRYIRIDVTELWKDFESYPAFLALSEIEVLAGDRNLVLGKPVRSADGMLNIIGSGGRNWNIAALSDGFGPDGRLVSTREWMVRLDRRLQIETRIHELETETSNVVSAWRNTGLTFFVILGLAGAFAIIALPIRYRIHSNRELMTVRERIAGDLHDEVGSNLGSIQMFADLAEGRSGASDELKRIQRIASETVSAVRDIVWLLRPEGDHRIGAVEHLRETSSIMLETLKWKFTADEASWQVEFPEDANRHLFLFFREALHNILRHARAANVEIRIKISDSHFQLSISDDGVGIDSERMERPATLRALRQRVEALGATLRIDSQPDHGTLLDLTVPLRRKRSWLARLTRCQTDKS